MQGDEAGAIAGLRQAQAHAGAVGEGWVRVSNTSIRGSHTYPATLVNRALSVTSLTDPLQAVAQLGLGRVELDEPLARPPLSGSSSCGETFSGRSCG